MHYHVILYLTNLALNTPREATQAVLERCPAFPYASPTKVGWEEFILFSPRPLFLAGFQSKENGNTHEGQTFNPPSQNTFPAS